MPGVIASRSGHRHRVSIRGSGPDAQLRQPRRQLYMDGIPINTSDGLFDLFEIDPTAYRYVEVFKGANALRFGANSLGGAINFVTPTGRDASLRQPRRRRQLRLRARTGEHWRREGRSTGSSPSRRSARTVIAITANGQERVNANVGYRLSPDAETRFYLNATRGVSELPGEVTKSALNSPSADPELVRLDQQRNIDSIRVANKTDAALRCTTGRVRRLHPPSPREPSDLSVARLQRFRLRRLRSRDR